MKLHFCFALGAMVLSIGCASQSNVDRFSAEMKEYLAKEENVGTLMETFRQYSLHERERQTVGEKQQFERQFENPTPVDIGSSPVKGAESATVTIVEFSDFQCPYCKVGAETMDQLLKQYPNDVRLVFKNLPLAFHPQARSAAGAAVAAGNQGKFWEMYELLFQNQKTLGADSYSLFAKQLRLDLKRFEKDRLSDETAERIRKDQELAASLGLQGTPAFYVNGVLVKGAEPLVRFQSIVDRWLARLKK